MATRRPWMPMYWDDYEHDTDDLSATEHGAYLLLIKRYWQTGEPLPNDNLRLRTIARCNGQVWNRIRKRILSFFRLVNGFWHHKRIDAELAKANAKIKRKAEEHLGQRELFPAQLVVNDSRLVTKANDSNDRPSQTLQESESKKPTTESVSRAREAEKDMIDVRKELAALGTRKRSKGPTDFSNPENCQRYAEQQIAIKQGTWSHLVAAYDGDPDAFRLCQRTARLLRNGNGGPITWPVRGGPLVKGELATWRAA